MSRHQVSTGPAAVVSDTKEGTVLGAAWEKSKTEEVRPPPSWTRSPMASASMRTRLPFANCSFASNGKHSLAFTEDDDVGSADSSPAAAVPASLSSSSSPSGRSTTTDGSACTSTGSVPTSAQSADSWCSSSASDNPNLIRASAVYAADGPPKGPCWRRPVPRSPPHCVSLSRSRQSRVALLPPPVGGRSNVLRSCLLEPQQSATRAERTLAVSPQAATLLDVHVIGARRASLNAQTARGAR